MKLLYEIGVRCYGYALHIASLFNAKAKEWVVGRRNWQEKLGRIDQGKQVIWFHVASYGEYEQGKTVLKALKEGYPNHYLLLTFFSPSGYNTFKNTSLADQVCYFPLDKSSSAKEFVRLVNPSIAIFVRYEFWFNTLEQLHKRKIPVIYFSSTFRPNQFMFFGSWMKKQLQSCTKILVRDDHSMEVLKTNQFTNVEIAGDTRFDTVIKSKSFDYNNERITSLVSNETVFVAGSTWLEDETLLSKWFASQDFFTLLILAPHELGNASVKRVQRLFPEVEVLGGQEQLIDARNNPKKVLLINEMGHLKYLYRYADIAYVGGGFGKGIHNLLEAVVYKIPVLFGPNHEKFAEAKELISLGVGKEARDESTLKDAVDSFVQEKEKVTKLATAYLQKQANATAKVMSVISKHLED